MILCYHCIIMIRETLSNAGVAIAERGIAIAGKKIGKQVSERLPHHPPITNIISQRVLSHTIHEAKPDVLQEEVDYSTDIRLYEICLNKAAAESGNHS